MALAARVIKGSGGAGIFLAVCQADADPSAWSAMQLVKTHGHEDRAIGGITKCDRLVVHDEDETDNNWTKPWSWVNGSCDEHGFTQLKHGYVATMNRKPSARTGDQSIPAVLNRQAAAEVDFFQTRGFKKEVDEKSATVAGLMSKVGEMCSTHVRSGKRNLHV